MKESAVALTGSIMDRIFTLGCYFPFVNVAFYFIKKDDDFIGFHARQGLRIWGLFLLFIILMSVIGGTLRLIFMILMFATLIVNLIGMYKGVIAHEKWRVPLIGPKNM